MLDIRRGSYRSDYVYIELSAKDTKIDLGCLDQRDLKEMIDELQADLESMKECLIEEPQDEKLSAEHHEGYSQALEDVENVEIPLYAHLSLADAISRIVHDLQENQIEDKNGADDENTNG